MSSTLVYQAVDSTDGEVYGWLSTGSYPGPGTPTNQIIVSPPNSTEVGLVSATEAGEVSAYPTGQKRIIWSDGATAGLKTAVLTVTEIDDALTTAAVRVTKLVPSGNSNLDTLSCIDGTDVSWTQRKIGQHLATANTVTLHQLTAGTLEDSGPNNWPLAVGVGTERYSYFHPSLGGFYFDGATVLGLADRHEALEITGELTVELIAAFERVGTASWNVLFYSASGETEATNVLYGFSVTRTEPSAPHTQIPHWLQEHGAGTNSESDFGNNFPFGPVTHLAFSRSAEQLVTLYVNGRVWGTPVTLTAPTGGSSSRLCIGGSAYGTASGMVGVLASVHVQNTCLTANQVKADYNHTLGPIYGRI